MLLYLSGVISGLALGAGVLVLAAAWLWRRVRE